MTLGIEVARVQQERETHGDGPNAQGISNHALDLGERVWICGIHPNVARNGRERGGVFLSGSERMLKLSLIRSVANRTVKAPEKYVRAVHQDHAGAGMLCEISLPTKT